ncbi:MAG TPA: AraC family transcriptional regulator [Burkholderiaceae bacterium]
MSPSGLTRSRATVAIGFVTGMLSGMLARSIDCRKILGEAQIAPSDLDDPGARVPIGSYAALYNLAVEALQDEGFALFSIPVRVGSFEFLCRSVVSSQSLAAALDRACRFLHLVVPDLSITVCAGPGTSELRFAEVRPLQRERDDPRRVFALEWILRWLHGLACWLVNRDLTLDSVAFPYAEPPHAADYRLIYTARSSFRSRHLAASLNSNLLELPIRRDDEALASFLLGAPGKIVTLYRRDREMVRRVRDVVAKSLPAVPSLGDVAQRLNLSARTVERRLLEEGSSLRAIKDALRRDMALSRLRTSDQSVAQIAASLGYADSSTFFRAFTAWTGSSPTAYRTRAQAA